MAAQLPPLPSPRSRQTEPPRVGLGRLKKLGRFYFAALAGASLCRLLLQLAAGLGPHRQVILRPQTTVRHSCAVAQQRAQLRSGRQEQRQWQQRQRGSSGRGAERGRACRGCTMRRRRSVSLSSSASDGWYPAHTACQITVSARHTPTAQHSEAALFANWTHARRTYAEVAPPWAVAVDEHAAVPRVDALGRSM